MNKNRPTYALNMLKEESRRTFMEKELRAHGAKMRGEGRRIRNASTSQAHYMFFKTLGEWRRIQNYLVEVADLKFVSRLQNIEVDKLEQAKKQIQVINTEDRYYQNKLKKY